MHKEWSYTGTYVQNDWHTYLKHYSSPYYDPVKAHEYYEEHKKLKGRTSTAGLSKDQRQIAGYVKTQLNAEKKTKRSELKEQSKSDISAYADEMNSQINSLMSELKSMRPIDRKANQLRISRQINALKQKQKEKRAEIMAKYQADSDNLNSEYENKYVDELDKLRSENASSGSSGNSSSSQSNNTASLDRDTIKKLAKQASDNLEAKKKK